MLPLPKRMCPADVIVTDSPARNLIPLSVKSLREPTKIVAGDASAFDVGVVDATLTTSAEATNAANAMYPARAR